MFRLPHPPLQTGAVLNRYSNNRDPLTDEQGAKQNSDGRTLLYRRARCKNDRCLKRPHPSLQTGVVQMTVVLTSHIHSFQGANDKSNLPHPRLTVWAQGKTRDNEYSKKLFSNTISGQKGSRTETQLTPKMFPNSGLFLIFLTTEPLAKDGRDDKFSNRRDSFLR